MTAIPMALHRPAPAAALDVRPIAFVPAKNGEITKATSIAWPALVAMLGKATVGPKDGPGWLPVEIDKGPRTAARVRSISYVVLDVEAKAEPVKGDDGEPITDDVGDIIKNVTGPEPPGVDDMLAELELFGWRAVVHTSYSHGPEHTRTRVVFDPSRPLQLKELRPLALHVASLIGVSDCVDTSCMEPARLYYLPRCPAERVELFQCSAVEGDPLDVDELLNDARKIEAAHQAARSRRHGERSASVIDAFNAAHDIGAILAKHGYIAKGRRRWLHPSSTTGEPGVRLLPDSSPPRVYSSHGADPLNDGHAHDAFDVFRILDHGDNMTSAVKAAAGLLGMPPGKATGGSTGDAGAGGVGDDDGAPSGGTGDDSGAWPEPQTLTAKLPAEPYPLDALPDTIRGAVEEVQSFVQAPIPLVASCALSAVSVACQSLVDVERAARLHGPVGLFLLTIADSGERKTTVDSFFTSVLRDHDTKQAEIGEPEMRRYRAKHAAWEAQCAGMSAAIRDATKTGKPTLKQESELDRLHREKPEAPRIPRLIYSDVTPESLGWNLAKSWPSAALLSSEAGTVFGSHGMGADSVMRNLSLLNVAWDGGTLRSDRRTSESWSVSSARLTAGLQVQEPTLRAFLDRAGALARGSGFLARFLVAWPESTQGHRRFSEAPEHWPRLAAFNRRLSAILDTPAPLTEKGSLAPQLLTLAPDAKAAWVAFHDDVEAELCASGELADVRDVASKAADNVARLAAIFHTFEGAGGPVSVDAIERASRIVAWHLTESRRFFGELALPRELADAVRLDGWLLAHCRERGTTTAAKNHVRQHGPLRDGDRLNAALRELADLDRLRVDKPARRLLIRVNPALVE